MPKLISLESISLEWPKSGSEHVWLRIKNLQLYKVIISLLSQSSIKLPVAVDFSLSGSEEKREKVGMAKQKWEIVKLWSLEIRKPVAALSITSYQLHLREASLTPDNHHAKSNSAAANVYLSKIKACKKST